MGKGEATNSRIFHQCYLKCCKLQNLTPLNAVAPHGGGRSLDFCLDRIKYPDWPPILHALSYDLSLHALSLRCRQPVKTVLEQIDCERLAKTVNKRPVILTKFMLSNLVEAVAQLLQGTTLLHALTFEGLPLKIPYLNPLCEALLANDSLQHIFLPRCLVGDAGCLALCKAVRCLPNVLTLDLSGCDLTPLGATYIADLLKYQKNHRYSENWVHTLRYRLPELDSMSGLRRITLCGNPALEDAGVATLLDVLADDLWIKALDVQNCGLSEHAAAVALQTLQSNSTLVVLDLRHNTISGEWLAKLRARLRDNERGIHSQYSWLGSSSSDSRSVKSVASKNGLLPKEKMTRTIQSKSFVSKSTAVKKEKEYTETLEEQLEEEISHRQQLEELNMQLVEQMKQLKQQQVRQWASGSPLPLPCHPSASSGSEQSVQACSDLSNSSSSSSSVPIDQNTLAYIQQAFKDIYAFIKNNQCNGLHEPLRECGEGAGAGSGAGGVAEVAEDAGVEGAAGGAEARADLVPKKAHSTHFNTLHLNANKGTKSAHMLGDCALRDDMKPEMIERQMGDSKNAHGDDNINVEEFIAAQSKSNKKSVEASPRSTSSLVSDSSDTLVCGTPPRRARAPRRAPAPAAPRTSPTSHAPPAPHAHPPPPPLNPRDAFYSDTSDDSS